MHRKKINKLAAKISKNVPGSSDYLSSYNKARSQVEKKLTDDQRQKYKAMAKEWSEKKLPPRAQQRYVYSNDFNRLELTDFSTRMMIKHGPKAIKDFTSSSYNQLGMRVVVLAAYIDGEGDPSMTL
jgi:hypothetical protein